MVKSRRKLSQKSLGPMEDDLQLVSQFQSGSVDAFGVLYDRYIRKIYDFVYFRTHHRETAEDLTSTSFMKALEKLHSFDTVQGSFQAWLYRIARNTVIDHYRTSKPTTDISASRDLRAPDDAARSADERRLLDLVERYLQSLSDDQREIVVLRVYSGLSYKEIAEILGKTEASCKMSFSRTVATLRERYPAATIMLLIISSYQ